jgi:hypothetical protein
MTKIGKKFGAIKDENYQLSYPFHVSEFLSVQEEHKVHMD